jgi:polyphosphate kinase
MRDMDIEILKEEAEDLLSAVNRELRHRKFGAVARLELTPDAPERIRQLLRQKLEIDERDIYEFPGPLGAASLFSLSQLPRPELGSALYASNVATIRPARRHFFHCGLRRDSAPSSL